MCAFLENFRVHPERLDRLDQQEFPERGVQLVHQGRRDNRARLVVLVYGEPQELADPLVHKA